MKKKAEKQKSIECCFICGNYRAIWVNIMLKCWCQCAWNHLLCHWLTVRLWVFLSVPVFFHVWPCHSCFRYPVIVTQQLHSWLRTQMPRKIQTHTNTAPAACEWFKPYHMSTSSFSDVMLQRAGRQVPISPYIALSDSVTGDRVTNTYIHTGTLFTDQQIIETTIIPAIRGQRGTGRTMHDNVKG